MTNTQLRNLTGRNWLVADFKKALTGATSTSTNCKALLCVLWEETWVLQEDPARGCRKTAQEDYWEG